MLYKVFSDNSYMGFDLQSCFQLMVKYKASDLHLKAGSVPVIRKDGLLKILYKDHEYLTAKMIETSLEPYLKNYFKQELETNRQVDFSHGLTNLGRFRFNVFYQRGSLRAVIRRIPCEIPTYDDLNLPQVVRNIVTTYKNGLVLITGPTGQGKSSTIMSMINHINQTQTKHILTIEDPIEFLIEDNKSLITQRELGIDYINYNLALKSSLRQDPNIMFFGELRDFESMETALVAANTGHLVLSTLHTNSAADTINRMLGLVSSNKKNYFRMEFASSLRAVVCQKLAMKKDQSGLIPVIEILLNNPIVRALLEKEDASTSGLNKIIEDGKEVWGMQSFNQHLLELVNKDLISKEKALEISTFPEKLQIYFDGLRHKNNEGINNHTKTNIKIENANENILKIKDM